MSLVRLVVILIKLLEVTLDLELVDPGLLSVVIRLVFFELRHDFTRVLHAPHTLAGVPLHLPLKFGFGRRSCDELRDCLVLLRLVGKVKDALLVLIADDFPVLKLAENGNVVRNREDGLL